MQFGYRKKSFDIEGVSEGDHIYQYIVETGNFYEIDLLNYIHTLKPSICDSSHLNIVLDVGANIGNHSVFLCAFVADHLIAIEPNPEVLPQLRRNLSSNVSNYSLYECAVGEEAGRGSMMIPENMGNNIGAAQVDLQSQDSDIEISTVDAVFANWRNNQQPPVSVALMKIDVEGMEPKVLQGAKTTIAEFKPHIIVEAPSKQEFNQIYDFLKPLGYKKLPGRWALTPVYHFAYNPSPLLYLQAYYMKTRRSLNRARQRFSQKKPT